MKNEIIIRDVKPEDAERLVEIYSYYVLNTAVSFEYKTPSIEEFKERIINILAGVAYSEKEDEYLSHDSFKYHIKEGYKEVAHINTVGKKFDRWYDLIWFQKKI